jgi:uncharacterized delta-60 repeat protein
MKKLNFVRTTILAGSLLLQLNTLCLHSRGAAGDVDLSFDAGSSVTNPVSVVVVQPDGKVLVGGPFTFINGTNRYANARLNMDGSRDNNFVSDSFNPDLAAGQGPNDYVDVRAVVVQSDGKVIVGGVRRDGCGEGEEGCQDIYSSFVIRLKPNGSRDVDFAPFVGSSGLAVEQIARVQTVALQADGKVLVGYDYVFASGIVRLNTNGTLDTNFNASITYWNSGVCCPPLR